MTAQEFKAIRVCNFATFSNATLQHYIEEGEKIISKMVFIDPEVISTLDSLYKELQARG